MIDALLFTMLSMFTADNGVFYFQEWFRYLIPPFLNQDKLANCPHCKCVVAVHCRLQFLNLFTELPFSRQNEHEADYIGLILAKQCGFDISKGTTMWEKMAESEGDALPEIFSTHPGHVHRSREIASWMKHVDCLGKHCTVF